MDKINNDLLKNSGKIDSLINTIDLQKDWGTIISPARADMKRKYVC
jgi:hypothetical protein